MDNQVKDELLGGSSKKSLAVLVFRYFILFFIVILLGVYIGLMLFGENSVEALYQLSIREKNLKRSIKYLKKENAALQKEYFELKELEPER